MCNKLSGAGRVLAAGEEIISMPSGLKEWFKASGGHLPAPQCMQFQPDDIIFALPVVRYCKGKVSISTTPFVCVRRQKFPLPAPVVERGGFSRHVLTTYTRGAVLNQPATTPALVRRTGVFSHLFGWRIMVRCFQLPDQTVTTLSVTFILPFPRKF